ncbi:MAG: hypothetical protein C0456_20190 [Hyphomonas sp.]|uniref:TetR/AcrR family transcriptional regulator n=1 Tax=Hyphomonas sp. TaxID=87 RepID=UPI001D1B9E3B|nr:TetR/AcrR family transcriptional regulator [Hyphomonas sp.]MBA4165814.1 hypothetical protein [Erythrobacter sp.]MBA4228919.1 hypothetical protein [Hyphomonas sp.]
MPKLPEEVLEDRRMQIIGAARRVFAAKGLSKVTLRDVFRETGLSAGAVYNYFKSKDDLILAVTQAGMTEALSALEQPGGDGAERLDQLIDAFFGSLTAGAGREAPRVDLMIAAEALGNEAVLSAVVKHRAQIRDALVRVIEQGQAKGQLSTKHAAATLAELLYAAFQGLIVSRALGEDANAAAVGDALKKLLRD